MRWRRSFPVETTTVTRVAPPSQAGPQSGIFELWLPQGTRVYSALATNESRGGISEVWEVLWDGPYAMAEPEIVRFIAAQLPIGHDFTSVADELEWCNGDDRMWLWQNPAGGEDSFHRLQVDVFASNYVGIYMDADRPYDCNGHAP